MIADIEMVVEKKPALPPKSIRGDPGCALFRLFPLQFFREQEQPDGAPVTV